ncbi:MAG: MFS transporter [Ilumatobacter sp.]
MAVDGRMVSRSWPNAPEQQDRLSRPRQQLLTEREAERTTIHGGVRVRFVQDTGPFLAYERTLDLYDDPTISIAERTTYRLTIPWFGWLFSLAVRMVLARRIRAQSWWSPPDNLDATQVRVIGLLGAASMAAAFVNTIFTQTVGFAADDFGIDETAKGDAGSIVRAGIVFALPAAVVADRIGRRRVLIVVAWLAPLLTVLGAFAPSFWALVASQTIARPMGIALAFVIGVIAAEEVPRNSRAYAVSVLAMAAGLGAGIAVMSLRLADIGDGGWRYTYLVAIIWLAVAIDVGRRLPETRRFAAQVARDEAHEVRPRLDRRRFALLATVAFAGNIFIAPASFFQNTYLEDVRNFSGGDIGLFSILVGTPAGIGLILGGRFADRRGRRRLISIALPLSTLSIVAAFSVGGLGLWAFSFLGGVLGSAVYPAMAVYRTELFPTANRTRAAGLVTASALVGGIGGLSLTGRLLDDGWSYSSTMALMAVGQLVVTVLVVAAYPETAHQELETLNPEDADPATTPVQRSELA